MAQVARGLIVLGIIGIVVGVLSRIVVGGGVINAGVIALKPITILAFSNSLIIAGLGLDRLAKKS